MNKKFGTGVLFTQFYGSLNENRRDITMKWSRSGTKVDMNKISTGKNKFIHMKVGKIWCRTNQIEKISISHVNMSRNKSTKMQIKVEMFWSIDLLGVRPLIF